jgi:hypothetical protein
MIEFIHNIYQLYNVSDLIGPSSGASFKAVWADWYVVIHVLLDASGSYGVVGRTAFFLHNIVELTNIVNKLDHKRTLCI